MRQELQNIEYIERYLENKLSGSDKYKFEQLLKSDPDFRNAVELQRQIVGQLKEEAFLADIGAFHQEYISQPKYNYAKIWGLLGLAVFTISSLSIGWWIYSNRSTQENVLVAKKEIIQTTNTTEENSEALALQIKAFDTPFATRKVKAQNGGSIQLSGETMLHIPANAIVDKNGNPVKGSFDLQYREMNDKAQMAFAGLPMSYKKDNTDYGFNSVGILELRAFKNGEELQVASGKKLTLDYELNKRASNLNLYHFDNQTKTWVETGEKVQFPKKGAFTEAVDSVSYKAAVANYVATKEAIEREVERIKNKYNVNTIPLAPTDIEKPELLAPNPNKYLVRHLENPQLVKALELNSFGVYNCSQIYQTQNQIAIAAVYTNAQKEVIKNARVLSVIDMNYNAAYSFQPDNFVCNGKANNVFLLWTNNGKLYGFVKRASVKLGTGRYSFTMEDLSDSIRNTEDLKRYLRFVEKAI